MSRITYAPKETYIGDGTNATYTFSFKIEDLDHLLVVVYDTSGVEVERVRGTDTVFLSTVDFDIINGGGTVVLQANLTTSYEIILLQANDAPTQDYRFRNKSSFKLPSFEWALDLLAGAIQRLSFLSSKSLKLSDRDDENTIITTLPTVTGNAGKSVVIKQDESGYYLEQRVTQQDLNDALASSGTPVGGDPNAVLSKITIADGDTHWEPMDFSGFSGLKGGNVSYSGLTQTIKAILDFTYFSPLVSLSVSGSGTVREKGNAVTAATFTATTTKRSDDIVSVEYFVGGVSYATEAAPIAGGGIETQVWAGSIADTTQFKVSVTDAGVSGGPSIISATKTFTYVYPYYYGIGVAGLTPTQVAALTKNIATESTNKNVNFSATSAQVYYIAYPASYGVLNSILDENLFETIGDWTLTVANIIGLDTTAVSYNIYEFNNVVTAAATNYTFKQ